MIRAAMILAVVGSVTMLEAQAPEQASGATFEVVSVKPAPDQTMNRYRPQPTRFSGFFTVVDAVVFAYQLPRSRVAGAPQWANAERYEINATTAARKPGDIQSMMRNLLADRFALKVHRERRPVAVYELFIARSDGRLGPQLQRVKRECVGSPLSPSGCSASFGAGNYRSRAEDWGIFVSGLDSRITGRPIVDKTGLSGQVDMTLDWSPEGLAVPANIGTDSSVAEREPAPALFTAIREQLGLRLEPATAEMEVLVIDSVERPTPD